MLKLYNTLSRKKEVFLPGSPRAFRKRGGALLGSPEKGKRVNLFVCGITPYDFAHLGHARTYIVFDMIVKYLKDKGFDVFYLQNITDIDDKIIKRAKEKKISTKKLARFFEKEYLKDVKALKIDSVVKYARATDYMKEIISQIKRLLLKNFAYQKKDGIYYDIKKFKNYGKLSRRTALQAEDAVSRIDESKRKRNKGDFCLWKLSKPGEPKWKSPFGPGRPGWHIEDTAITEKFFGPQYDIHGGARDLIFPHHEAEIAQMEAISDQKPMVKYWLHSGFLTIKGQKMAKSLNNFITIKDFIKKNSSRILRIFVIKNHYRSPIDYNENIILQSKRELEKIDEFVDKLQTTGYKGQVNYKLQISKFKKEFEKTMEDDFNTPKALAVLFKLINEGNSLMDKNRLGRDSAGDILKFLRKIDRIFNFIFWQKPKTKIPKDVLKLIKERQTNREKGDWRKADNARAKIKQMGYLIEDTKKGPKIRCF
ncbi:MAG: cysteine--tRNA ligase [Candidatus Nealsonbacteria bacterium]|nr:cysteine--tRNA ligase [Candidatus Nealsonbacteria bacterium]